jgi:Mn2+/Fe2+ NRAMP family transporter
MQSRFAATDRTPPGHPDVHGRLTTRCHLQKSALQLLGPGLITDASDDDPSGICHLLPARCSVRVLGRALALTYPLRWAGISAQIGRVTGRGLPETCGAARHAG